MAANIEVVNGKASFYGFKDPPWWDLGFPVSDHLGTWQEVIEAAQMNWEVEKRPLYGLIPNNGYVELPTWGIFRADNNDFIGSVGKGYTPIQNKYAFEFVDALLEADNGSHYDTAGVLGKGERIFVSAKIPHDFTIGPTDDIHSTFLVFVTSHDGSLSTQCFLAIVRPVCSNTVRAAIRSGSNFIKVKHTKESGKRLEASKKWWMDGHGPLKTIEDLKNKMEFLGQRMLNKETYVKVLDRLFPASKGKEDESSTRRNNIMLEITRLFEKNDNDQFPVHRGTCLNLLNAITEYTDHVRGTRITEDRQHLTDVQARSETSFFGSGAKFKEDAFEIIMEEASGCQERPYATYIARAIQRGEMERAVETPSTNLLDSILESHEVN